MRSAVKRSAALSITALATSVGMLFSTPVTHASTATFDEYLGCGLKHGLECFHADDAKKWAERVTAWKFADEVSSDKANSFQHCAWMGALATRFGAKDAYRIGGLHEVHGGGDTIEDKIMDHLNNYEGVKIGAEAKERNLDDQWGYVLEKCEAKARAKELFGKEGVKGRY